MAKRFLAGGRVQDLLIKHAGSKRSPATDTKLVKLLGLTVNNLHSGASRSMRQDPHFHAGAGPNGEWIYYMDGKTRNRLIDTPKRARKRRTRVEPAVSAPILNGTAVSQAVRDPESVPIGFKKEVTYWFRGAPVSRNEMRELYLAIRNDFPDVA